MPRVLRNTVPPFAYFLATIEAVLLVLSFYVSLYFSWVSFGFSWHEIQFYLLRAGLFSAVVMTSMFSLGLYQRDGLFRGSIMVPRLVVAFLLALILLAALSFSLPDLVIWRSVLAWALPTAFLWIVAARFLVRDLFDWNMMKRRIAVIGSGVQARRIEDLHNSPYCSFNCAGYVRINSEPPMVPPERLLPKSNDLTAMLKQHGVEELVIATLRHDELPTRELVECRLNGIRIVDYQAFHSQETGRIDLDFLTPEWFFVDEGFQAALLYRWLKRSFDLSLSALLMVALLPLLALISILTACDGGSILYRQRRTGLGGTVFTLLKFRSMREDAEPDGKPMWSTLDDDRVTPLGRFLRRTRLDELPQIWNILKGEMSFVGPRPERPYFVEQLSKVHEYYLDRHAVKPGLTGWAQINFSYGSSSADARRKLEYDLYYIKYGNLLMDIFIILQTLRVVVWPEPVRRVQES